MDGKNHPKAKPTTLILMRGTAALLAAASLLALAACNNTVEEIDTTGPGSTSENLTPPPDMPAEARRAAGIDEQPRNQPQPTPPESR